ncbi:MAG: hypothetical protein VCB82_03485 [Alphaproteobacteria bacterium]
MIEENLACLNHGSYGAVPRAVLAAQNPWRHQLERQPVHFINEIFEPALRGAADRLANFVGAETKSLVFVSNSIEGVNAVSRSLSFGSG